MDAYLDSSPVIYLVEHVAPWDGILRALVGDRQWRPRTSLLTRMKCRVGPMLSGNDALLRDYDAFFAGLGESLIALDQRVMDKATVLRARHRLRTPDAIHLAAAIESGCDTFVTNDATLRRCDEITVHLLDHS